MFFPVYFKRKKGAGPADIPDLGSDTDPTVSTKAKTANADNVASVKVGGVGNAIHRIAIGYWYEGGGAAVTLPVKIWAYDRNSEKWYQAASGTLTNGQLTYLRNPYLADPPQTSSNMSRPTAGGGEILIVIADNTSPDGTCHFVAGPDTGQF